MDGETIKGKVISGEIGRIVIRQKSGASIELGELLIADVAGSCMLLQVYDLQYASQISQQNLELISGLQLEEQADVELMDQRLRQYTLALAKSIAVVKNSAVKTSKLLPAFFSTVRALTTADLGFLTMPRNPLFLGKLRSGSQVIDADIFLDGKEVLAHHILIAATTGRGKSNLTKCMLWDAVEKDYAGMVVLDPHDEYYGRSGLGLKDHPRKERVVYYTPRNPPPGGKTLKVNLELLVPSHFHGVTFLSQPQQDAMAFYYKKYGKAWVEAVVLEKPIEGKFMEETLAVVRRKLLRILSLEFVNYQLSCHGVFDLQAGMTTISDIVREVEQGKIVIIDTSLFGGSVELLIGSMISSDIFSRYKEYKVSGVLDNKPVVSIVLEEAPRVLGKEALEQGGNIFSTIAREGRKFKVGLTAITQLPSLIPREILANMNTKIILGMEMAPERQAVIESASQDLSSDSRNIASLDKGEAIVTSNFAPFAIPIRIPLFQDVVKKEKLRESSAGKMEFGGVKMG
ncbi:ATP-binding protein [Candidatus Woesearchaeota archaeon]|nr:ATP-binding protein [Candidatus Woesearchaeota archaeon]